MGEFWAPGAEIWLFKKKNMDRSIGLEWINVGKLYWLFACDKVTAEMHISLAEAPPNRKCCLLQCCCVILMQNVLILCRLCCFYANSAVLMQIVLFWCKLWHLHFTIYAVLSQMTFLSQNTRFSRHFWVCYQAPITFNDVCPPVPQIQPPFTSKFR